MTQVENFGRLGRYEFVHLIQACLPLLMVISPAAKPGVFPPNKPLQVDHDDLLANIDDSHRGHPVCGPMDEEISLATVMSVARRFPGSVFYCRGQPFLFHEKGLLYKRSLDGVRNPDENRHRNCNDTAWKIEMPRYAGSRVA